MVFDDKSQITISIMYIQNNQRDIKPFIIFTWRFLFYLNSSICSNKMFICKILYFPFFLCVFLIKMVIRSSKMKMAITKSSRAEQSKRKQKHEAVCKKTHVPTGPICLTFDKTNVTSDETTLLLHCIHLHD